jgi:hypothetical protein
MARTGRSAPAACGVDAEYVAASGDHARQRAAHGSRSGGANPADRLPRPAPHRGSPCSSRPACCWRGCRSSPGTRTRASRRRCTRISRRRAWSRSRTTGSGTRRGGNRILRRSACRGLDPSPPVAATAADPPGARLRSGGPALGIELAVLDPPVERLAPDVVLAAEPESAGKLHVPSSGAGVADLQDRHDVVRCEEFIEGGPGTRTRPINGRAALGRARPALAADASRWMWETDASVRNLAAVTSPSAARVPPLHRRR